MFTALAMVSCAPSPSEVKQPVPCTGLYLSGFLLVCNIPCLPSPAQQDANREGILCKHLNNMWATW